MDFDFHLSAVSDTVCLEQMMKPEAYKQTLFLALPENKLKSLVILKTVRS